jgi:dolichyl-phosphate-mannose-protein mannosyltransferase
LRQQDRRTSRAWGSSSGRRRAVGAVSAGTYAMAVLLNFAYLYPVLAAQAIPYSSWLSRMWFRSWI